MAQTFTPARKRGAKTRIRKASAPRNWRRKFIAALGETSNVSAAAAAANITLSHVYKLRRDDESFARAWFDALAEGYDNLEMELLQHLRGPDGTGGGAGTGGQDARAPVPGKARFDAAIAFRCLAAHRDTVAREKGRRTLASEVATIEAINAKIDRLRLNGEAATRAVAKVRKDRRRQATRVQTDAS